eukprot:6174533-Pleurochrysis_carterae.AAC.2
MQARPWACDAFPALRARTMRARAHAIPALDRAMGGRALEMPASSKHTVAACLQCCGRVRTCDACASAEWALCARANTLCARGVLMMCAL